MEILSTSLVPPAVTRSRARCEKGDKNSTEEPTLTPPKQTSPVLTLLTQTSPVPSDSAAIDNNRVNVLGNHEDAGKEVKELPVGEHHNPTQSPAPPASPILPDSEPEGITRTECQEGFKISSLNGDGPMIPLQQESGRQAAGEEQRQRDYSPLLTRSMTKNKHEKNKDIVVRGTTDEGQGKLVTRCS